MTENRTWDKLLILLAGANNNEPFPSLTHAVCERIVAGKFFYLESQFKSWILDNEKGLLYNQISANREHEDDVL